VNRAAELVLVRKRLPGVGCSDFVRGRTHLFQKYLNTDNPTFDAPNITRISTTPTFQPYRQNAQMMSAKHAMLKTP